METKSDRILTSVKLWFLLPLPCEIKILLPRTPSKMTQNLFKKRLCNQTPPKSSIFNLRAPLDGNIRRKGFQKGPFWGGPGAPKTAFKGTQSAVENRLLKADRVFLQIDAKMSSQSDLNWPKSFQKRSLETSWMKETGRSNKHILWLGDGAKSQ